MTSTSKKIKVDGDQHDLTGYIHSISPIKTSEQKCQLFNAVFQTKDSFQDVVAFNTQMHEQMLELEKNKIKVLDTSATYDNHVRCSEMTLTC
ncbi:hypothetical protein KUTeg_018792 [Tegillarca granosa]|uniref:Uncharacterized protein n=1 Tax=Tegillarca granosa TaxID=220873 RepID=A0ABQ9EEE7_TEGGR|nr:hypothetical protein KUTeg_018792 [Tegillarca granosa]